MSGTPADDAALAPHEELAELLADLQALVAWEGLRGASLVPVEAVRVDEPPPGRAARGGRTARSGGPPPRRRESPSSPAAGPASRPAATSRRKAAPPEPPAPRKVALKGRWADLARREGMLDEPGGGAGPERGGSAGGDGDPRRAALEAQRKGLRAAVERDTGADRLTGVREVLGDCRRCGLCEGRRNIVFGVGNPEARLVVLGEAPGAQEDVRGEPFVGPAGELLDRMLQAVLGLSRDDVYILNMVKCRPPDNRNPQLDELKACRPFLLAQLASIQPDFVLAMGSVASRALWGQGITRARGSWRELRWPGGQARVMPTFHPAYLLRRPEGKRDAFHDLKALDAALKGQA